MPTLATVILDPATALLFGCALAIASAGLVKKAPEREVARTGLWGAAWGVFYGLCVGWFYFNYPDWMFAYLKDARTVPLVPTYLAFVTILAASGAFGAVAGSALLAHGKKLFAWALFLAAVLTLAACFWLQWKQYVVIGTLDEYLQGRARPLAPEGDLKIPLNVTGVVPTVVALAALVVRFVRGRAKLAGSAAPGGVPQGP